MPKGKPSAPHPTSIRLGDETRALWAELAEWLELKPSAALAVAIRELHDRERERRAKREKRT